MIALLGLTAIYLTQQNRQNLKKYACLFGLASQPFWLYTGYANKQWGIFIIAIAYTFMWGIGVKNNFLTKR